MDIETYFAPAIELGSLVQEYYQASGENKERLALKISQSPYIERVRNIQSIWGGEFLGGIIDLPKTNKGKKDFFVNPAVPSPSRGNKTYKNQMPYHKHDYLELIFVLRGEYVQSINGTLHKHTAGDICMLNPNVIHRDENLGPDDRVLFVGISKNYLFKELSSAFASHAELTTFLKYNRGDIVQQYVLFNLLDNQKVEFLLEKILAENEDKLSGHHLIIKGLLVRLFSVLVEKKQYKIYYQTTEEIHQNLVAEILEYMEENIAIINREDLASFFHFHPDYINRLLYKKTGNTYSEHLRQLRLERAAGQLRETTKSVNVIIQEIGISNKGYFNRIFKEKFGVLPGIYRKQI